MERVSYVQFITCIDALTIADCYCQKLSRSVEGGEWRVHFKWSCVSYFRTYFNRHFKEPICCVSDSMTEDAAVFGGQKNMFDGLENARAIYKPEMIAVSTTCMAEVIGDDLSAFIKNARQKGCVPKELLLPPV